MCGLHSTHYEDAMYGFEQKALHASRRRQIRFPLRAPVTYRWTDTAGLQRHARGRMRDISEVGVFVRSQNCPNEGDFVELTFRILTCGCQRASRNSKDLEMGGIVVRVDRGKCAGEHMGFAIRNKVSAPTWHVDDPFTSFWEDGIGMAMFNN